MTCPEENSTFCDVLKLLTADGFNGLGEAVRRLINEAMRLERQGHLGVGGTTIGNQSMSYKKNLRGF